MAIRRMFSNRIANSAKFLQMPPDAQLLYFHMVLRADDDGVVEAYPITKLISSSSDSFKILIIKKFIRQLNEDQVVIIIDWLEHNKIRSDRKTDSIYKNLLKKVFPEIKLLEAKPRSDVKDNSKRTDGGLSIVGIREERLGEVKLSKEKKENSSFKKKKPFYLKEEMRKSQGKWWVIPSDGGQWLEFVGRKEEIKWK